MSLWDNKDAEQWESSVPADLQPAVKHLRKLFDKAHFNFGWTTKNLCFAQIHQSLQESEHKEHIQALVQLKAYIPPNTRKRFNDGIAQGTLPGTFKAFLDFYVEGLSCQAALIFKELLEIGATHEHRLGISGIDWAQSQTKHLIRYHRHNIVIWVRDVCDEHRYDPNEDMDERIYWRKWQAPTFLVMKPSRFQPYDPTRVWERFDPQTSSQLLEAFADDYVIRLEMEIERQAGQARLEKAKRPKLATHAPVGELQQQTAAFTWKELETRFRDIQARTTPTQEVRAEWTRTEWNSGSVSEEWEVRGTAVWRSEYAELASIGARKLGYAPAENAYKNWLGRVWKWMRQVGLDKDKNVVWCPVGSVSERGSEGSTKHLFTQSIAELSAKFCLNLIARGVPELAESDSGGISHGVGIVQTGTDAGQTPRSASLNYSSATKRAVLVALTKDPTSSDLQVWRSIDADGSADLPDSWATPANDRSFELAYKTREIRPKMEKMTTKVRADMRSKQLM